MKVQDIMSSSVYSIEATGTIAEAARSMSDHDVGVLPVVDKQRLVGIVTDRDITVRAIARAVDPGDSVREIMTPRVATCLPQDSIDYALEIMSNEQVRRVPVCTSDGELVGIVTLADAAERDPDKREVGIALEGICEPSGPHCQTPMHA